MKCFCGRTIESPRDEVCHECMAIIADAVAELENEDSAFAVYDSYVNPDKDQDMPFPNKNVVPMLPRAHGSAGVSGTTTLTIVTTSTVKKDNNKKNEEPISWVVED